MSYCGCNETGFKRFIYRVTWGVGSIILLLLRVYIGWMFMKQGYSKLIDIPATAQNFSHLGVANAEYYAWAVGLCEMIGGALLFVGLLARLASIPLIIIMIAAYWLVDHAGAVALFSDPKAFTSSPEFLPLLTSLLVFSYGAGYFSLDCFLFCRCKKGAKKEEEIKR